MEGLEVVDRSKCSKMLCYEGAAAGLHGEPKRMGVECEPKNGTVHMAWTDLRIAKSG